jgi:hypothetical protein
VWEVWEVWGVWEVRVQGSGFRVQRKEFEFEDEGEFDGEP